MALFASILMTLMALYLIVWEPIWGTRSYRRLLKAVAADPGARLRYFKRIVLMEWGLVLLVLLAFWFRNAPLSALGLQLGTSGGPIALGVIVGMAGGLALSVVMGVASPRYRASIRSQLKGAEGLLPATATERRWWIAVAVTAGICEEVLFRGFLIYYFPAFLPALSVVVAAVIATLIFGMAHLYQGVKGVLVTGLLGALFAVIYIQTGSLLCPILLHVLTDLRILPLLSLTDRDQRQSA